MKQWEIYDFPHPSAENPHPCIVLSTQALIDSPDYQFINCLACKSSRADAKLKGSQVLLDEADKLDGPTIAKCAEIYRFLKAEAGRYRGTVCYERKRAISVKLIGFFGLVR